MRGKAFIYCLLVLVLFMTAFTGTSAAGQESGGTSGKHVLHIVWDGLSSSLYANLKAGGLDTPNIDELVNRGTMLTNVTTTIPSYGGAQAALVTGAYPGTNGFTYRYYDKTTNAIISNTTSTYKLNGQTIFEAIKAEKPELRTLAAGYSVSTLSLENRGVSAADESHKLIEYARGDSLVGFANTGNDIINAISSGVGIPEYTLAYSNDIKMLYWGGGASDQTLVTQKLKDTVALLDSKLGEIIGALKTKGIYDNTIIIINSLSSVYTTQGKIDGSLMAADILSTTGVSLTFGTTSASSKAVIVKNYVMKYAQLSFTNQATQEDKDKILAYLSDPSTNYGKYVKSVLNPADYNAPSVYADYLINPLDANTFCAAGSGSFRTDNLDDMNQFCVVSGTGVIKGAAVGASSVADITSCVSRLLGISPPANNEGSAWDIFDMEAPVITMTVDGTTDTTGAYTGKVRVVLSAADNNAVKSLQVDTGEGMIEYTAPFEIDKDCTLKVTATDTAGNTAKSEKAIAFLKLIGDVGLTGDYELINDCYYTDSSKLAVSGKVLVNESSLVLKVNGNPVTVDSSAFSQEVELAEGLNTIEVQAYLNGIGNSVKLKVYRVFNPIFSSFHTGDVVSSPQLNVAGTCVSGSTVTVNGIVALVDEAGNFNAQLTLVEGENAIKVVSTIGKYTKETDASIGYYIPAVITISSHTEKQVVREAKVSIKGSVDKACTVTVNGEAVVLDDALKFSKRIGLSMGVNEIKLEANYHGVITTKMLKLVRVNPDDVYTVYINWDGFAKYYYDLANANGVNGTPVLNSLMRKGVMFTDAYTGIPSITNPMQASILSGAWPASTGNCYRYFDKGMNTVIQFARENKAETIAEAVWRQGLKTASVNQFMLQDRGAVTGDPNKPYIDAGGAYDARFDAAMKLIKGEEVGEGAAKVQLDEIPRFMALYMDDLDGLGHNEAATYGVPVVSNEADRKAAVLERLKLMDAKLGDFIQACKDRGIYENMAFVLTTDHGMAPFGQQGTEVDEYTYSKLPDVISTLDGLGYKAEVLFEGQQPAANTKIAIVCVGLQAQLSFTGSYTENDVDTIVNALKGKAYTGNVMKKAELLERGALDGFADLLVSPKVPYSFKTVTYDKAYIARGQHDSLEEEAQHIFALMWGKGVKKGLVYNERMYSISFAQTLTALMGINKPADATGAVLRDALEGSRPPKITITGVKNRDILKEANIGISVSGGQIVEALLNGSSFTGGTVTTSGSYTLSVKAADRIGNVSCVIVSFTIDNTPPVITISGVKEGDIVREVKQIKVSTDEHANMTMLLNGHRYNGKKIDKPGN